MKYANKKPSDVTHDNVILETGKKADLVCVVNDVNSNASSFTW